MAMLTRSVGSLFSLLGVLVLVGAMAGAPNVASAGGDDAGVLHACVYKDRSGRVHGYVRIVLPTEPCRRFEERVLFNVGGQGDGSEGGGSDEYGTIHGQVLSCLAGSAPVAGSFAAVAGQESSVVFTNGTGEFLLHAPAGTHELVLGVPGVAEVVIVSGVEVSVGQTTEVDPTVVCYPT
jgi:hypothetical protein